MARKVDSMINFHIQVTLIGSRVRNGLSSASESIQRHYELDLATRRANGGNEAREGGQPDDHTCSAINT